MRTFPKIAEMKRLFGKEFSGQWYPTDTFERLEKAWFEKGQFSKIEELYMSMLEENPEYLPAIIALSEIYRKKGEHSQALKLLENASKSEVDPEQIKIQMIRVYIDKNQYKEASKLAMEVIENKA